MREVRRLLGDAYDRAQRVAEARDKLQAARDEYVAKEPATSRWVSRVRERWGRFLLKHSKPGRHDFEQAEAELKAMIQNADSRLHAWDAQAHAGLARAALARREPAQALESSERALALLARVQGVYDLRIQPELWLVHSDALLAMATPPGRGNGHSRRGPRA